ncbi:MAG TPA: hypothetical protein VFZ57_01280 [Thermoanaerobaculia bacterium]|nr:hypothetical protein [Thermoanaerobaculia bacterium]
MPESFDRARLGATLRACRALRHELATPLSAAALHLEVARRAVDRAGCDVPEKVRSSLRTALSRVERTSMLLDVLTALGDARVGEPAIVDFRELVVRAAREAASEIDARGLEFRDPQVAGARLVFGFGVELQNAVREALLAASRWAGKGEALLRVEDQVGTASFWFRVPLGADAPGDMLFRPYSRPGAGFGPFAARWTFEAHGGTLEGLEDGGFVTVTGSVPQVAP